MKKQNTWNLLDLSTVFIDSGSSVEVVNGFWNRDRMWRTACSLADAGENMAVAGGKCEGFSKTRET